MLSWNFGRKCFSKGNTRGNSKLISDFIWRKENMALKNEYLKRVFSSLSSRSSTVTRSMRQSPSWREW